MDVRTDDAFVAVSFEAGAWQFAFANGTRLYTAALWRVIDERGVRCTSASGDPSEVVTTLRHALDDHRLVAATLAPETGDLLLALSGGLTLEVLIATTGLASYELRLGGETYIGGGSERHM